MGTAYLVTMSGSEWSVVVAVFVGVLHGESAHIRAQRLRNQLAARVPEALQHVPQAWRREPFLGLSVYAVDKRSIR